MPRPVHAWTKDKLLILERYLPGYLQATTSALERVYIDAFSGPGTNSVTETRETIPGSPLIALNAQAQNGTRFDKFVFIDKDRNNIEELKGHVRSLGMTSRCEFYCGDVNDELPKAVVRINKRSPTFVFLDTEGIEPRWNTLEAVAPWRVEFLINFPLGMSINRNERSPKTIDYFGTTDCIPILQQHGTGRVRALLDLYKSRLAKLGFSFTTEDDRLVKAIQNQALYYLVFVSKVMPAKRIMDHVLRQPDSKGQRPLF